MAACHLHSSLSFCIHQKQRILQWKEGAPSLCPRPTLQEHAFHLRASSCPLYAMASSTLQVGTLEEDLQEPKVLIGDVSGIEIQTLRDCRLGIAMYPDFVYNADGGGGFGRAEELQDGKLAVDFAIDNLYIPSVESKTTSFLGLPLPPFLCIQVVPKSLKGFIERSTGKVELEFAADFLFSVGSLYRAPPLVVNTLLTTETAVGRLRRGQGRRLDSEGKCRLVGVAPLVRIEDAFMNAFLTLPTDCLAIMEAKFNFSI